MRLLLLLIVSSLSMMSWGQQIRVGFYNVENLFDTINQPNVDDGDFTPLGSREWDSMKYLSKINNLASTVDLFSPDILGLCEVENYDVVNDFARRTSRLRGVVHYDSRDSRGIDVALIYDTAKLQVISSEPIFMNSVGRNFLKVKLLSNKKVPITVFVVHLPSKLGGTKAKTSRTNALNTLDSLARGLEHVIMVGDFNDSPQEWKGMFNCAIKPFQLGEGSYAYLDVWDMIDQMIISRDMLPLTNGIQRVVRNRSLFNKAGRYAGYPAKGTVSDHLPVYVDFQL